MTNLQSIHTDFSTNKFDCIPTDYMQLQMTNLESIQADFSNIRFEQYTIVIFSVLG